MKDRLKMMAPLTRAAGIFMMAVVTVIVVLIVHVIDAHTGTRNQQFAATSQALCLILNTLPAPAHGVHVPAAEVAAFQEAFRILRCVPTSTSDFR